LLFYRLLLLGFYGLHWIDIFLNFPKIPSLLKSEFGCKSYRIFVRIFFAISGLGLNRKLNQNFNRKLDQKFPISTRNWTENFRSH
jgi:hypothetical protein